MLHSRAKKLHWNGVDECQVTCMYVNYPLVVNKPSRQEEGTCRGKGNDFLSLLNQHWQNFQRCKTAYAHYHGDESIRSLNYTMVMCRKEQKHSVQLRPSLKASSVLPSVAISSCFSPINIFFGHSCFFQLQGFGDSMRSPSASPADLLIRLSQEHF